MNKEHILETIKDAMRAKDKVRLSILRQIHEEIKKIEVDQRRDVTDVDVDACIKKLLKMTTETLEGSIKAGTDAERTEKLTEQVKILEDLLPEQLSGTELEAAISTLIAERGFASKKDMGALMAALTEMTGGNFDKPAAARHAGSVLS